MSYEVIGSYEIGDLRVEYVQGGNAAVGLLLVPASRRHHVLVHRQTLEGDVAVAYLPGGDHWPAAAVQPLAQVKIVGDAYAGGFAQGRTMRGSASTTALSLAEHHATERADGSTLIHTVLSHPAGWRVEHHLVAHPDQPYVRVHTELVNDSDAPLDVELLTSFSLTGLSPFAVDYAAESLRLHRFRSNWSAEGRHENLLLEDLHIERSWAGFSTVCERFGQVGSMPVRGFFPFVGIEDSVNKVFWGAQLACSSSWQMEVARNDDYVSISGGLADREFGHWVKHLQPGESLLSPEAVLTAVVGTIDDLCHALVAAQTPRGGALAPAEDDLPVIFNEWCTTWGDPSHENILKLADTAKELGAHYLVIDAGWYKPDDGVWSAAAGDWEPNERMYPHGFQATIDAIRERGLVPGLWFEFEAVGPQSRAWQEHADHLLTRDGLPLTSGQRRFWDMRDPWCQEYLAERVIGRLRDCGIGYIKVDYNETLGIGVDGAESLGEGLRQHLAGVHAFFRRLRREVPGLTIESCSSGGHRLEPMMQSLADMGSFSDAHEGLEIPIIAANLQRLIQPRQSQIWAVLHGTDSDSRLIYSLAATFLGRMCLSGDVWNLSTEQRKLVKRAVALYREIAPIIRAGRSRRYGPPLKSWRAPQHWQGILRTSLDGADALAVLHTFSLDEELDVKLPLLDGTWQIVQTFACERAKMSVQGRKLVWKSPHPFEAAVVQLRRR